LATLAAVNLAIKEGSSSLYVEGYSSVTILAINQAQLFTDWAFALIISDIQLKLQHFQT
jgi:hypothetical protein